MTSELILRRAAADFGDSLRAGPRDPRLSELRFTSIHCRCAVDDLQCACCDEVKRVRRPRVK